jgi:hypothetical protein
MIPKRSKSPVQLACVGAGARFPGNVKDGRLANIVIGAEDLPKMKLARLILPAIALAALTACGGGGGVLGNNPVFNGAGGECQTGTSEELASPTPGAYAQNVNSITIVANSNNNALYQGYQNWYIYLTNSYTGQTVTGGQLNLVPFPGGPQPYPSDFYYSSQLQQTLPSGGTWNVYLTQFSGSCQAVPLQSFTT